MDLGAGKYPVLGGAEEKSRPTDNEKGQSKGKTEERYSFARIFTMAQGVFVRVLFSVSSVIAVWRVATVKEDPTWWLLVATNGLLYFEAYITFRYRKSGEWKWFCPSVMVYLASTVPAIWILELQLMEERVELSLATGVDVCLESDTIYTNGSTLSGIIPGIEIPLYLPSHLWSLALQQTLLFVLIVGRWLLPKGALTRDQLSQLLLVYIGIAADILEFSTEGLKMEEVRCDYEMVFWILAIWTWSLLQFTLGLTATKARKPRMAGIDDDKPKVNLMCCETEVWGLMTTIVMQDGPFLAMRLYILIKLNAINQMMIFFTCKNMLVMLLQVYRLFVIYIEKPGYHPQVLVQTIIRYSSRRDRGSTSPVHRARKPRARHLEVPDIHDSAPGQCLPLLPTLSEKPPSPPLSSGVDSEAAFFSMDVPKLQPAPKKTKNARPRPTTDEPPSVPLAQDEPNNHHYDPVGDSTEPLVRKYPPSPARLVTFDDM